MSVYNAVMVKVYTAISGRSLDSADIPKVSWWINFAAVAPWAIFLYLGMLKLAGIWERRGGIHMHWAAWASMAGSMAFGWFGMAGVYLPVAAISVWLFSIVIDSDKKIGVGRYLLAGLGGGLSGMYHPSGWLFAIWGVLYMSIGSGNGQAGKSRMTGIRFLAIGAIVGMLISLGLNWLFFGRITPVQWISSGQMLNPGTVGGFLRQLAGDLVGWNGIIWLAPLAIAGVLRLAGSADNDKSGSVFRLTTGILVAVLLVWGVAEGARNVAVNDSIPVQLKIMPVEVEAGTFKIVDLGPSSGSEEDRNAYFERVVNRTDVFVWNGGRSPGIPVMMPVLLILALYGWCSAGDSGFRAWWKWIGVRFGLIFGLIASQAAWGNISEAYLWVGTLPNAGHMPMLEAVFAVAIRIAEWLPSGIITF